MLFFHHEVVELLLGPSLPLVHSHSLVYPPGGGGVPPITAYTGRLRPKGVGILLVEVYERVGKSVIWVCKRAQRPEQLNSLVL